MCAESFDARLCGAAVLDAIEHAAEYASGVLDGLLVADLGFPRPEIGDVGALVVSANLERGQSASGRLLEDQCDVQPCQMLLLISLPFVLAQSCCEVQDVQEFLRRQVDILQEVAPVQVCHDSILVRGAGRRAAFACGTPIGAVRGTRERGTGDMTCTHLDQILDVDPSSWGCEDCLAAGRRDWVHLRVCQTCGHVGCCDNSPGKHATAHFKSTGHPIIRSYEPGEDWYWCYLDDLLFELEGAPPAP